jgi:hypothetical protein
MESTKGFTPKVTKDPEIDEEGIERIEMLEARIAQLETALKNTVTFETLAARLVGNPENKKVRKPRTKRELTPEEKAAFHARMVAGRLAKEKSRNASKK